LRLGQGELKDGGQFFPQGIGYLQGGGIGKQAQEAQTFLRRQVSMVFTERPHHILELGILGLRQFRLEASTFAFAELIHPVAVMLGDVKPINDHLKRNVIMRVGELFDRIDIAVPHIGADRVQRGPQVRGDGVQKLAHGFLFPVG